MRKFYFETASYDRFGIFICSIAFTLPAFRFREECTRIKNIFVPLPALLQKRLDFNEKT